MDTQAVDIVIAATGTAVEVFFQVRCAAPAGPLKLDAVELVAPGRWQCHFVPQRDDLEIRYPSVLKLQDGLSREFAIVKVECHTGAVAA